MSPRGESRWQTPLAAAVLLVAAAAAYWNSLAVPFLFDDLSTIVDNPALGSPGAALAPAFNVTTTGRPVLNLTFALNHAISGRAVWSYHAGNLLIHALAGLVLFGLVRRTLRLPLSAGRAGPDAFSSALLVAALWLLHPLQTESVTYVVQRAESLAGLFCLLTLYLFVRGASSPRPFWWLGASVTACLLGMGSKEVMVSAPLLVLLHDRTFVTGTFSSAWRQRRGYYLLLAATWLPLAWLVAGTASRGGSAGFSAGVSPWDYLLTQCGAIVHYLTLTVWPHPLVLDYGTDVVKQWPAVWGQAALLLALAGGTVWALVRRPWLGFLGVWFFALLAPSSSLVPVATQTMAEHRMYLPLLTPVALAVAGLHAWLGRRGLWLGAAVAAGFGLLTAARNTDYRSALAIWTDTVAHRPGNARARYNLAIELTAAGRPAEAAAQLEEAVRLRPDYAEAHLNLGNALALAGDRAGALRHYEQAVAAEPDYAEGRNNLGYALAQANRLEEAKAQYEMVLRLRPDYAEAQNNFGEALARAGDLPAARGHFAAALRLKPDYAEAHNNVANDLLQQDRLPEAIGHYERALQLKPGLAVAHSNLALALLRAGRPGEAAAHYRRLLELEPGNATAHNNLGYIHWQQGRLREAIAEYEAALRSEPDNATAQAALAQLRR